MSNSFSIQRLFRLFAIQSIMMQYLFRFVKWEAQNYHFFQADSQEGKLRLAGGSRGLTLLGGGLDVGADSGPGGEGVWLPAGGRKCQVSSLKCEVRDCRRERIWCTDAFLLCSPEKITPRESFRLAGN